MEQQVQTAMRVSGVSIAGNALLSAGKLAAGLIARSGAMVSDAIHSSSDVISSDIVIVGVKLSKKAPDREHPYGHERLECVAAIILAMILLATGLAIGYAGVRQVLAAHDDPPPVPGVLALVAAVVSIAVKEAMFWYTRHYALRIDSSALMADAWHHRSDALSSVGALIGIAGARMGLTVLEPLASIVICAFIGKAAFDIFKDAVNKMVDHSCDPATEDALRSCVLAHPEVRRVDLMRTREFGNRVYVELEVAMDETLTLAQAHRAAEQLHDDVEKAFSKVKHIMIHVNPYDGGPKARKERP